MKKLLFFVITAGFFSFNLLGQAGPFTSCVSISSSTDDAEEEAFNGIVYLTSSDLELVNDPDIGSGNQTVGLRFQSVNVPQGATIQAAYIQFTTDETDFGFTSLIIKGEDVDHPFAYSNFVNNISGRITTSASVGWIPSQWNTVGAAGLAQRTPDLSNIVQEIVNRPGFFQTNAMAFVVTGAGERTAASYDGAPAFAPRLCITYTLPPTCTNTSPFAFSNNIISNSVVLNWTAVPSAIGYRVTGGVVGSSLVTIDVSSATTSLSIGGLGPNVSYNWIVQGLCGGPGPFLSPSSNVDIFTTLIACLPPSSIFTSQLASTSVRLNWTTQTGVLGYRISGNEVGQPGEVTLDVIGANASFADIFGLASSTSYFWKVQSICASGGLSAPTPFNVFTTLSAKNSLSDGSILSETLEVSVYPNPASKEIYVNLNSVGETSHAELSLYDLNGKLVINRTIELTGGTLILSIPTHIPSGMYQLQVSAGIETINKKVLIQK